MDTSILFNGRCAVALGVFLLGGGAISAKDLESSVDSHTQNAQSPQNTESQPSILEKLLGKKQSTDSKGSVVYDLGQIEATAEANSADYNATTSIVDSQDMQNTLSNDMGRALRFTSGVFYMPSATTKDTIYIRGFSEYEIGYYLDGIPVNDTFRGNASSYTDTSAFTTFGLSEISVSKGYISPSFGADMLGGAINMVTSKPKDDLEIALRYQFITDNENRADASIGRNLGRTYYQLTYSQMDRKSLQYSYDYGAMNSRVIPNTARRSQVLRGKYGYQPDESNEYSLNFHYQNQSFNGGWNFVDYDATTLYALGDTKFSKLFSLNSRVYYHSNLNQTIDSAKYDDFTAGLIETGKFNFSENQNLKIGLNLKYNDHKRQDNGESDLRGAFKTLNASAFAEYALRLNSVFRFALSASYDRSDELYAMAKMRNQGQPTTWSEPRREAKLHMQGFSLQGILYATLGEHTLLHANIGKKTNIPNMATIHSHNAGWGFNAPSSNISPESAINYELGADFTWASAQVGANVFYNDINAMLISVQTADTSLCEKGILGQSTYCLIYKNAASGHSIGGEIYAKKSLFDDILTLGLNWSYVQRKSFNRNPDGSLTYTSEFITHPRQLINFNVLFAPQKEWNISFNGSVQTSRYAQINVGSEQTPIYDYAWLPSVVFFDIAGNYFITDSLRLSLGAYNLLDKNYNYSTTNATAGGLPGRRLFVSVDWKF